MANDPFGEEESHVFANFRLMWRSPEDRFNAQVFVTNAFNEAYLISLREAVVRAQAKLASVEGIGRLWGVKLGIKF